MNEEQKPAEQRPENGWIKLFHRSGALVTIPVTEKPLDYAAMAANVDAMIAAGFAVQAAGLEAGEEKEMVGHVIRGQHDSGRDITDFVLLYSTDDGKKFSFLKCFLNTDEDVAAFEAASGMKLNAIPVYVGQDKPERGKNRVVDQQFMRSPPKPFGVVFGDNPKWKQSEADAAAAEKKMYTKPKRVFIRWADLPTAAPKDGGECISEKEAANLAEIMMRVHLPLERVGKFIHWLGGAHGPNVSLDDLQSIPKSKYRQGLIELQRLEQEHDRKAAGS